MQEFSNNNGSFALTKFEKMLKSNKIFFFDSDEFEEIIYHYLDLAELNLAKKAIELGLTQHPGSLKLMLLKVEVLILEDKDKEAGNLLEKMRDINPIFDEIYIQKAAILSKNNKHLQAVEQLKIALDLADDDDESDIRHLLGLEYLFIDDFNEAIEQFSICLKINNNDFQALYNLMHSYEISKDYNGAIKFLNSFIDEDPYNEFAWHQLGLQYKNVKKYNEAIRAFDYALLIDEFFSGAYFEKAKTLQILKKYKEAIDNYYFTLTFEDPSAIIFTHIADCYKGLKNNRMAVKYYYKAVKEDPLFEDGWIKMTKLLMNDKKFEKALYYINKALEIDNNNTEFLKRYAEINIQLNLFEEAAQALNKAVDLGEDSIAVILLYADLLHFLGEYNKATNVLLSLNDNHPDHDYVYYRLSGMFFSLKQENEGFEFLDKALKLNPESVEIFKDLFYYFYTRKDIREFIKNHN